MRRKEKARKYDGTSRPPDDIYRKNWEDIFGKKKEEKLSPDDQEYLDKLKEKL